MKTLYEMKAGLPFLFNGHVYARISGLFLMKLPIKDYNVKTTNPGKYGDEKFLTTNAVCLTDPHLLSIEKKEFVESVGKKMFFDKIKQEFVWIKPGSFFYISEKQEIAYKLHKAIYTRNQETGEQTVFVAISMKNGHLIATWELKDNKMVNRALNNPFLDLLKSKNS